MVDSKENNKFDLGVKVLKSAPKSYKKLNNRIRVL